MPELSIIQWAGAIGAAVYAAYRAWPMVKAKLPAKKLNVTRVDVMADTYVRFERERALFDSLCVMVDYCERRDKPEVGNIILNALMPLLLSPPAKPPEEARDETD